MYAALNAPDDVFDEAYRSSKTHSFRSVGERFVSFIVYNRIFSPPFSSLHNYSTRSDSLDLRVVDVPKLLCQTYQLKEQMNKITEQQQTPLLPPNGDLKREDHDEQQIILSRINELEQELDRLRLQLSISDKI